ETPAAVALYDRAIPLLEEMVRGGGALDAARVLARACLEKADALTYQGEVSAAVPAYDRAISLYEPLVAQEPITSEAAEGRPECRRPQLRSGHRPARGVPPADRRGGRRARPGRRLCLPRCRRRPPERRGHFHRLLRPGHRPPRTAAHAQPGPGAHRGAGCPV